VTAAVVGGGVVGCAVALALARRGVEVVVFEARESVAGAASGTNSGILHTGFDSPPGELESELILRANALRDEVIGALAIPVLRCGAVMRDAPTHLPYNDVEARREDGDLVIPGEWVTDPVAFTRALAAAAEAHGVSFRLGRRVVDPPEGFEVVVNCAGLYADEVARGFGDESFSIYPRKGEFLVFDVPLDRILLPTPTARTKGVLVFPTVDGRCIAGPTAVDVEDKEDWSVRDEARAEIMRKAVEMHPPLRDAQPIASYAGLRPAGRGVNYLIGRSEADERLINVAAIRSTGLSASLGIAEHVADLIAPDAGVRPLAPPAGSDPSSISMGSDPSAILSRPDVEWWRKA
jgi:glycerol-3-phosphate dehydrogenase